ncbi:MAG: hypothetical protein IPO22_23925 [Anaerolineales bacterium]|nr:hypothetical protein [Anaerolineales bacterium]
MFIKIGRTFVPGAERGILHMAHGGSRYLENGEFRLVREAVRERNHPRSKTRRTLSNL